MQISIGCVRARFARHIAVLILVDACASALGFYLFGFAFAFGDGQDDAGNLYGNNFIGFRFFAMHDMDQAQYFATAVRPYAFWVFEWAVSLPAAPASIAFPQARCRRQPHHCGVALITCFAEMAGVPRGIVRHCCLRSTHWDRSPDCSLPAHITLICEGLATLCAKRLAVCLG